jgi:hypothetical protein
LDLYRKSRTLSIWLISQPFKRLPLARAKCCASRKYVYDADIKMVLITLQLLCSLLFITSAVAQRTNFPVLPRPNDYSDGKFLVPNTAQNQVYPNGIQLNVTWQTTFPQINLFFIIDNNFAQPVQLLCK